MVKNAKKTSAAPAGSVSPEKIEPVLSVAYFDRRMYEMQNSLKEDIRQLKETITKQNEKIEHLETKVERLENELSLVTAHAEENEQYSRRMCLRIEGIEIPENEGTETADDVLQAVKKVISECGVAIPDDQIDRAHRIGKSKTIAGKRCKQVILRLMSFRYRSALYKARKNCKKYRIYLDLTKHRKDLLQKANDYILTSNLENCFAFADLNCRLCFKHGDDFTYFTTYEKFLDVANSLAN